MLGTIFVVLFAALIGIAALLWGYRIFLVLLPIWGFFAGLWLSVTGTTILLGESFLWTVTGLIIGVVIGLVAAVLSYLFYTIGVAIFAGAIGGMLGSAFMVILGLDPGFLTTLVTIASAVLVALLALIWNLQRYIITALTSLGGAALLVTAFLLLFGQVNLPAVQAGNLLEPIFTSSWVWILTFLVLFVVGFVFQIRRDREYQFSKEQYIENWG